jgi:hypothetical protein
VTTMKERFSVTELSALRNDLLQGGQIDSREAAELLQVFLMGRGYGVSRQAAFDAAGRVEMAGCSLPVLQSELESLAMVM